MFLRLSYLGLVIVLIFFLAGCNSDTKNSDILWFEEATSFLEGLALVKVANRYGYLATNGKYIVEPRFEDASPFAEGLAAVKVKNKWGFIDKTGKVVIKPEYDRVFSFAEESACINVGEKWGFIDKT